MNCVFERIFEQTRMAFRLRVLQRTPRGTKAQICIRLFRLDPDHQPGLVTAHGIQVHRRVLRNGSGIPHFRIRFAAVALPYGAITKNNAMTATLAVSCDKLQDTVERLVLALAAWHKAPHEGRKKP